MARKQDGGKADPRWRSHLEPAPGELRIVQALVNSGGDDGQPEALGDPRALADWLGHWGLLGRDRELRAADLEQVIAVRSALRALIRAGNGPAPDPEVMEHLDRAAAKAPSRVRFTSDGGARFEPAVKGLGEALARLFEIVALAQHGGLWQRLKLCQREGCRAVFYDFSNAINAKWCSASCGDRLKAQTYRGRRKRYRARTRKNRPLAS